ncbi:transposase [Nonomuraea mesophila]|uniref:transposase n=1 Tax=Nonomuraea mesophila TaxID=2530382 RepID=UPI00319E9645
MFVLADRRADGVDLDGCREAERPDVHCLRRAGQDPVGLPEGRVRPGLPGRHVVPDRDLRPSRPAGESAGRLPGRGPGHPQHRHHQHRHPALRQETERGPPPAARAATPVAGQGHQIGQAAAEKAAPGRGALRRQHQSCHRQADRDRGRTHRTVIHVDPSYTSQQCSACGHVDRNNRPDQETFSCTSCGFAEHADVNAARNIASRGETGWAVSHAA